MAFKIDPATLNTIMKTAVEGEAELIKSLEEAGKDEKHIFAQVATFRVQKSFADQLSSDDLVSLAAATGFELTTKAKSKKSKDDEGDDEGDDDEEDDEDDDKPAFLKGKSKKSKDKKMEKTKKSADDSDSKLDMILKSVETLQAQNAEQAKTIKSLTDDKVTRTFVTKAEKEFGDVPGSAEEIGLILKSAHAVSEAFGKQIEGVLGRANKAVSEASILTKSIGSAGADKAESSAMSEIVKLADGMVAKSEDGSLTQAVAIDMVLKTERGNKLYNQYLAEHPEQLTGARS